MAVVCDTDYKVSLKVNSKIHLRCVKTSGIMFQEQCRSLFEEFDQNVALLSLCFCRRFRSLWITAQVSSVPWPIGSSGRGGGHMRDDVLKFIIAAAHKINDIGRSLVAYGPCANGDGRVVVIKLSPAWSFLGISWTGWVLYVPVLREEVVKCVTSVERYYFALLKPGKRYHHLTHKAPQATCILVTMSIIDTFTCTCAAVLILA